MAATAEQTTARTAGAVGRPRSITHPVTVAVLVMLTVLSFAQRPGRITFDTKLDLTVAPASFLARALHMWNPEATFGELQNQAYGYLFPVGPFFMATQAAHMPTWMAQRLWCALLLCGAFLGALLLARALNIGAEPARHLGALCYALAPRMVTEIGPLSVEMLPAVLLPWVLLPLVRVDVLRSPRRAAALSGLAVFAMGGTNAAMVLMALTLPGIWLLTRQWTGEHGRLVAWWCVSVLAATLWWIVPLLLLAGYSLPFLRYIESSANTTAPLSLVQALRGTNQWVAYVVQGEPWWPAGFMLVDNPVLMAATALVAGVGLLGLARPGLPERGFLLLGTLTGLVLLTLGHIGPLDSPVAEPVQRLLDGPLAALRNVHKFDPVLRLTLAMGFVHAVSRPLPRLSWRRARFAVAALLVVVMAAPAWLLALRPGQGWTEVPPYWRDAARWLAAQDGTARTLMLPATGFGEYRWGRTVDEPIQALADAPWAVRNQIPLGSEGNTRFMDTVSDTISNGRGSPALADFLSRAGVRFLLLRNDLDRSSLTLPPVAVMHQALARSPGISPVATFGPSSPAAPDPRQLSLVDQDTAYPALEVYEVRRPVPVATVASADDLVTVSGGPESVLPLLEQGLLRPDQPAVLAGDVDSPYTDHWVVTDGLRRRERNVGRVRGNLSQTLAGTDPVRLQRPTLDLLPFSGEEHQTVAQYAGVRAVVASTSAGYADAFGETDPSQQPFAAVDGDPASLWRSSSFTGPVGQWLQVRLDTPRVFDNVTIDFAQDLRIGWPVARIRITTDRGSVEHDVAEQPGPYVYPVLGGPSGQVRVTVLAMRGGRDDGNVAIRELTIPGVAASRMLRVPVDVGSNRPPALAFSRDAQPRGACFTSGAGGTSGTGGALRCEGALARVGEEPLGVDRRFRLSKPALYVVSGEVLPRLGSQPWLVPSGLSVSASSQLAGDPAVSARLAFDRDPTTSWIADPTDPTPAVTLHWPGARTLDRLSVQTSAVDAANPPLAADLHAVDASGADQVRHLSLPGGTASPVSFEPLVTDNLRIELQSADQLPLADAGHRGPASVGVAELRIPQLDDLLPAPSERSAGPAAIAGAGCGFGPPIEVDGKRYDTLVFGSEADVRGYQRLRLLPCGSLDSDGLALQPGDHRLRTLPTDSFVVHDLTLTPLVSDLPPAPQPRAMQIISWLTTHRSVQVSAGPDSYLVVPENANHGWVARLDGRVLTRARMDGWQQAWFIPAGPGGIITVSFEPDRPYRTGLYVGGTFVLALLCAALLPVGRRRGPPRPPAPTPSWWGSTLAVLVLLLLLGGPAPVIALLACLLLHRLWSRVLPAVLCTGVLAATGIAVAGRLLGHGQDWAFGLWAQAAILVAVSAAVAAFLYPPC